jgi:hypothetical protein
MSKSVDDLLKELQSSGVLDDTAKTAPPGPPLGAAAKPTARPARPARQPRTVLFLILAAALIALIGSVPFGSLALYPFGLFVTLIHETSHAIAAIATGGTVASLQINPDLSGVMHPLGGLQGIIAPAGYLGATLAGAAILLTPLRYGRYVIGALAAIPLLALLAFHPAGLFTGTWEVIFFAALGLAAWKLPTRAIAFLQVLLGVEAALNAGRDLLTLFFISSTDSHIQTDAQNMAQALFGTATMWAVLWTVLSLVILVSTLLLVIRRDLALRPGQAE